MLKRSALKPKKNYTLKKTVLKAGKNYTGLKKTTTLKSNNTELKKTELAKQNEKARQKWEEIRQIILKRDNNKCVVCKKPATQVHHIHLRSKRKDLLYAEKNLVSLCDKCHAHKGTDNLEWVNRRIAFALHMTLEELLQYAESEE